MLVFSVFVVSLPILAYATPFEGKILNSDSVFIQFGKDILDSSGFKIATIEKVEIKFNESSITVSNPQIRFMADSFVIKSFEDNLVIYGFNHESSFNLRTIIFAGEIIKFNDYSKLNSPEIKGFGRILPENETPLDNLHVLVQNPKTVFNTQNFTFDVKTFDKSQYFGNDFQNFFGKVNGVKIAAVIKDPEGNIKTTLNGVTEFGEYSGNIYIPENLWSKGWYSVEISAKSDLGEVEKTIEFYVAGQTPPSGGNPCPSGQSLNATGVCV